MKKLMDEEIIKALECCGKEYSCERCILNTWLNKKRDCVGTILGGAFDLINRQKAEIERLKAEIRNTDNALASLDRPLIEVKSEAYKEFAERLKGKALVPYGCLSVVCGCDIDNLLKEMAGE